MALDYPTECLFHDLLRPHLDDSVVMESASTGLQAYERLTTENNRENGPNLIIMPEQIPMYSGAEWIGLIKKEKQLQAIPVVVFATIVAESNINSLYEAGASSVLELPDTIEAFERLVAGFAQLWLRRALLPYPNISAEVRQQAAE